MKLTRCRSRVMLVGALVAVLLGALPAANAWSDTDLKRCDDAGSDYLTAKPEEVGLDSTKLMHAVNLLSVNGSETVQVFRNNCQVAKGIFDPVFQDVPSNNWSQTKTVTALLVGRAVTLGKLSVDDPIGKYVPPGLGDAAHRAITVRQLLTQTSGVHMNWTRELNLAVPDRIREFMALPIDHRPGTYFRYDQTGPSVVLYVVQKAIGEDVQRFAQRELFEPMGLARDTWFWLRDRTGHTEGWSNLFLPGNQFGRIGQLLANGGTFHGRRLIAEDYLSQLRTPTKTNPGYGYLTWLNAGPFWTTPSAFSEARNPAPMIRSAPDDMYFSYGFFGQHIFVLPSLNIVVTRSSGTLNEPISRTDTGDPVTGVVPGQPGRVEYEFFKLLMESVRAPRQEQVKPYVPAKPGAVDSTLLVNPRDNMAAAQLGPGAPKGCTIAGCAGRVAAAGTVRALLDVPRAGFGAFTRAPAGFAELATRIPDLAPRLADGWAQTARIMGQQLPDTVPALLGSAGESASHLPLVR